MTRHQTQKLGLLGAILFSFLLDGLLVGILQSNGTSLRAWAGIVSWIGNRNWIIVVLLISAFVAAMVALYSEDVTGRRSATLLLKLAVVLLFAILLSGVCAQTLKYLLGRARPVLLQDVGAFSFAPLSFDLRYTSFPSSHATTMGAVAMVGTFLAPRYRAYVFGLAGVVALAKVLDGSAYISDAIAGLALGVGVSHLIMTAVVQAGELPKAGHAKWTVVGRWVTAYLHAIIPPQPAQPEDAVVWRLLAGVFFLSNLALVIFISKPAIDIAVSNLFFAPQSGFWLDQSSLFAELRSLYLQGVYSVLLSAVALWYLSLRLRQEVKISPAVWGFVVTAIIVGPGLITNSIFKEHWGRARPANIDTFGGEASFTLPFRLADECARNCSFVSGEGSAIAMVLFLFIALAWPHLRNARKPVMILACGIAAFGIAMRVMMGRHFFSDTIFAVLIMAVVAIVLYRAFNISRHRQALILTNITSDWKLALSYMFSTASSPRSLWRDLWRSVLAIGHIGQVTQSTLISAARCVYHHKAT